MTSPPAPPNSGPPSESRWRWPGHALLWLAVAVGAVLRLDQLDAQIVAGDEWHAVRFLLTHGYREILTQFGLTDHSIPLTLFYAGVAQTVGLTENWMRAPSVVLGLAAIVALPLAARTDFGTKTALIWAWLLAISPMHVFYSRFARPYAAVFLFGTLGALAFLRWWKGGGRAWMWTYVACATLTAWFHLAFLPFAVAPLAWGALVLLLRREGAPQRGWRALLLLGAVTAAGLGAVLLPPVVMDFASLSSRSGSGLPARLELGLVYELATGTSEPLLGFVTGLALLLGLVVLRRERRAALGFVLFAIGIQALALCVARPAMLHVPLVFVRYQVGSVALLLLVTAAGLAHLDALVAKEWMRVPRHLISPLVVASLLAFGPLVSAASPAHRVAYQPNAFWSHDLFQKQYEGRRRRQYLIGGRGPRAVPAFYSQLAASAADPGASEEGLVEVPWFIDWNWSPFVVYQRIHRRPVFFGSTSRPGEPAWNGEPPWPDARIRFRNHVHLDDEAGLRERGVRYVVLHKALAREFVDALGMISPSVDGWIETYRSRHGEPCYEDELLCVFDLAPGRR